jgi:hypothetical protein
MRNQILLAALAACACLAAQAAPRAYVSSAGRDNGRTTCELADPCRTFQKAHDMVDPRGEVVALDGADFGPLSVAKSVSIIGSPGAVASIVVTAKEGVLIERPGVDVVLRNLHIAGAGGVTGVDLRVGASLTMEDCVVSGLAADGIRASTTADVRLVNTTSRGNGGHGASFSFEVSADVMGSRFLGNGGSGLQVESSVNRLVSAAVNDSVASGNALHGFAVRAIQGRSVVALTRVSASHNGGAGVLHQRASINGLSTVLLGSSLITANAVGVDNTPASLTAIPYTESLGNNIVRENGTNVLGAQMSPPQGI